MRTNATCCVLVVLMSLPAIASAQTGSRLIGSAFRGEYNGAPMVLSDSMLYEYSGQRGGDLTTPELKFDRSYDLGLDVFGELELQSGQVRTYDAVDNIHTDSSQVLNVPFPYTTSYLRWTYDPGNRPASRVGFQGTDSVAYASYAYTPTDKIEVFFYSSLISGTWYNTTETYTYDIMDSLTDKVVNSDWLSYSFHWDYSPEGWLTHHEQLTPSGDLFLDYWYHPNGKLSATRAVGVQFGPQNDSVAYAWNAQFDTVMISSYNLLFGGTLPVSQRREAYDDEDRLIESIYYEGDAPDSVPLSRIATEWDGAGNPVVDSLFSWDGSVFVHVQNDLRSYDAMGHRTERIVANRVGPDMTPVWREYATYNVYGQITSSGMQDTLAGGFNTIAESRWYYEDFTTFVEEPWTRTTLRAFPNPCDREASIPLPPGLVLRGVDVFDAAGRQYPTDATVRDQRIDLSTAALPAGVYAVRVRTDIGISSVRVMVE